MNIYLQKVCHLPEISIAVRGLHTVLLGVFI